VLIDDVLTTSRAKGHRYVEGLAHRLLAECLAQKSPTFAAEHIDAAQQIFISTDARNDLAKVLVTRAGLCQNRMYARPEVRAGVARLAAHGLVLDAWCYHPQLTDVIALVRAVPQATIVMCHVGGVLGYGAYAGKKDEIHAEWRASIAELATCPNVSVKLGGMLNRGAALNFREHPAPPNTAAWAAAWRPYVEPCIELFGAERCSFESNFPVDKMGTGYATLWNAFKRITAGCSPTEKLALYSGTAKRLYRLD
jgi:predicted TIM-barrel fold metal-dependent hydrolase